MNRKFSHREKSLSNRSITQVRMIYQSNKKIDAQCSGKKHSKNNNQPMSKMYGRKLSNQKIQRKSSVCESVRQKQWMLPPIQLQQLRNIPAFKKYDSQSTAEDLTEKIRKQEAKQLKPIKTRNKKMMSFLLAQVRQNSQQTSIQKQYPTITVQHQNPQHPKRKVLHCKIIRNAKIPFIIQRKTSEKQKKLEEFQAGTQHISEIKIATGMEFISPQSKFLIDF